MQFTYTVQEQPMSIDAQNLQTEQPQPKITLFYRATSFEYCPPTVNEVEEVSVDSPVVLLRYRGTNFIRKMKPIQPYQKPQAINWRWQYVLG